VGAFGKEAYLLTGYLNVPKVLEITLNNGIDPVTGKVAGIETGDPLRGEPTLAPGLCRLPTRSA
jgi:pyruvate-formate lyase